MKTKLSPGLRAAMLAGILFAAGVPAPSEAAPTKSYPLKVCMVTGNELGSMGKVVTKNYGDRMIKFCCAPCVKKFDKDPGKYMGKLK